MPICPAVSADRTFIFLASFDREIRDDAIVLPTTNMLSHISFNLVFTFDVC